MPKLTIKDVEVLQGKTRLIEVFVSSPEEASACAEAGIELTGQGYALTSSAAGAKHSPQIYTRQGDF